MSINWTICSRSFSTVFVVIFKSRLSWLSKHEQWPDDFDNINANLMYVWLRIHGQFFVRLFALIREKQKVKIVDLDNWAHYHWRPSNISRVCRTSFRNGWYWWSIDFSWDINFEFDFKGKSSTSIGKRFISKKWRSQRPLVYQSGCRFDTGQGQWILMHWWDFRRTECDEFIRWMVGVIFQWFDLKFDQNFKDV